VMMKSLGMVLIGAAAIAFLVPRLHVTLPEGVSMPTCSNSPGLNRKHPNDQDHAKHG
jgi:hypothetical protein